MDEFGWINLYNPDEFEEGDDSGFSITGLILAATFVYVFGSGFFLFFAGLWILDKLVEFATNQHEASHDNMREWLDSTYGDVKGE